MHSEHVAAVPPGPPDISAETVPDHDFAAEAAVFADPLFQSQFEMRSKAVLQSIRDPNTRDDVCQVARMKLSAWFRKGLLAELAACADVERGKRLRGACEEVLAQALGEHRRKKNPIPTDGAVLAATVTDGGSPAGGANETVARVRAAIDRLSEDERTVVRLNQIEGKSFAEVNLETGIPISTARRWKREAFENLRSMLDDAEPPAAT